MSNAYFRNSDSLTVGSNVNGPQVQFEYAGRLIQIPVPPGVDPLVAVNDYVRALRGGFGSSAGFDRDDLQPSQHPDNLDDANPSSGDDAPTDSELLNNASVQPNDPNYGNQPSQYGSSWTPDGVNTVKGYQPRDSVPVLQIPQENTGVSIPVLEGFFQGTIPSLPKLRLRRQLAGTGMMRGN